MNNKRLIAKIFNGKEPIMTIDRNMLSCEFGALDRGNITDVVNWGIYANRGSISFIDNIGYFNNKNVNSTDIKKHIVKFYLAKNQEPLIISTFKVDTVDFDDETRRVDIQLIGKIIDLQNKPSVSAELGKIDIFPFDEKSAEYLLGLSKTETDEDYKDRYPAYGLSIGTDSYGVKNTYIYCPYLQFGTQWDKLTKFCQATMSRVIEDENGNAIITGEMPLKFPIIVNPKNIVSISKGEFVKFINPSISLTSREKHSRKKLEQLEKHIDIKYKSDDLQQEDNEVYISGAEYDIGDKITDKDNGKDYYLASVSFRVKSTNKIFKVNSIKQLINKSSFTFTTLKSSSSTIQEEYNGETNIIDNYETIYAESNFEIFSSNYVDGSITSANSVDFSFFVDYFQDGETETINIITDNDESDNSTIESNDLIQTESYYNNANTKLGEHILNEVVRRYGNGRECFEIECLFNDYYDVTGNKVFDTNDLSNHFKKYDLIIPYVNKKGQAVPLRVNQDGRTPKQFRVIGISYSYDGLLKQKLSVQEERYDID